MISYLKGHIMKVILQSEFSFMISVEDWLGFVCLLHDEMTLNLSQFPL